MGFLNITSSTLTYGPLWTKLAFIVQLFIITLFNGTRPAQLSAPWNPVPSVQQLSGLLRRDAVLHPDGRGQILALALALQAGLRFTNWSWEIHIWEQLGVQGAEGGELWRTKNGKT